jgi:hypothetical protein
METEWMKKVRKPAAVPRKIIPYKVIKNWADRKELEARQMSIKRLIGK